MDNNIQQNLLKNAQKHLKDSIQSIQGHKIILRHQSVREIIKKDYPFIYERNQDQDFLFKLVDFSESILSYLQEEIKNEGDNTVSLIFLVSGDESSDGGSKENWALLEVLEMIRKLEEWRKRQGNLMTTSRHRSVREMSRVPESGLGRRWKTVRNTFLGNKGNSRSHQSGLSGTRRSMRRVSRKFLIYTFGQPISKKSNDLINSFLLRHSARIIHEENPYLLESIDSDLFKYYQNGKDLGFKDYLIETKCVTKIESYLDQVTLSINELENCIKFGKISRPKKIIKIGRKANMITSTRYVDDDELVTNFYENLIIIDRETDLISPLLTSSTVEGTFDDIFGIDKDSFIRLDATQDTKFKCHSTNQFYNQIRNLTIPEAMQKILEHSEIDVMKLIDSGKAKLLEQHRKINEEIKIVYKFIEKVDSDFDSSKNADINLQNEILCNAFSDSDSITETLIKFMKGQTTDLNYSTKIIKLIALFSLSRNGLVKSDSQKLVKNMPESCKTNLKNFIENTEKLLIYNEVSFMDKIFDQDTIKASEDEIIVGGMSKRKSLDKVGGYFDGLEHREGQGLAQGPFCYNNNYVPITVRLVDSIIKNNYSINEKMTSLFNIKIGEQYSKQINSSKNSTRSNTQPYSIVYILGGISYSEISSFRNLGQKIGIKFIFLIDRILNGERLIESLF